MMTPTNKPPVEIISGLDLSAFPSKVTSQYTHVLNMCTTPNPNGTYPDGCSILHIQLLDLDNITPHIPHILNFIDSALQDPRNRVLVSEFHSPTIAHLKKSKPDLVEL